MDSAKRVERAEPARGAASLVMDRYFLAACGIFAFTVVRCWTSTAIGHEVLYLLGSRRIADPTFLAVDFTWSVLPPTSFLYDHMLAPLWRFLGETAIVNLGRLVWWASFAAALSYLGRTVRLPAWTLVAGFATWMLWGQSFALCGSPFEGFQVKSLAYPLILAALAFAIRGRAALAGAAAGLGTAMHVIVGGWALLALGIALLVNRSTFSWRRLWVFALASVPFVVPLLLALAIFHAGGATRAEQARMDEIYVKLAAPKCCDPQTFLTPIRALRAGVLFALAPVIVAISPRREANRLLATFLVALIVFFLLGLAAAPLHLYGFLKLLPFQLATSLPALFFFLFLFGGASRGIPRSVAGKAFACLAAAAAVWLALDRNVLPKLVRMPRAFFDELQRPAGSVINEEDLPMCTWIRDNTPAESVFVTPFVADFWARAERAQVASIRHPPFDRRLIEWRERLVALNGSEELEAGGFDIIPELDYSESSLTDAQLVALRERYGATHYVTEANRSDLGLDPLYSESGWFVYDIRALAPRSSEPAAHTGAGR